MQAWRSPSIPQLPASPQPTGEVRVFDTAEQQVIDLGPRHGTARMYVCGITPYDATHMGHANTYLTFDLLNRVWRDRGLDVGYVQNITDIDDPLLERAEANGEDWAALAEREVKLFTEDMDALRVLPPDQFLGVVESMDLVVELVDELRRRDAIYPVDDPEYPDLYFRRGSDAEFGSLGHLDDATARPLFAERGGDPERPGKEDPFDGLVWRLARPGEPAWDAPLGRGRPGWHVECTAIALQHLGTEFDVNGGGSDLIFPHHEMCAAQGRVATGKPYARAHVHAGMVGLDGEKMSKSQGNLVLVSELRRQGVDPMAIRLALLANRYRTDWSWTTPLLRSAERRLDRWRAAARRESGADPTEMIRQVRAALAADLDAPTALTAVDDWADATLAAVGSTDGAGVTAAPETAATAVDALLGIGLDETAL